MADDCYFYYYSTCSKGNSCEFRHEAAARGTEEICEGWEFGSCMRKHCPLRHMRIQVHRNTIQCYWELQPSGCQKPHCAFQHTKPNHHTTVKNSGEGLGKTANSEEKDVPSPKVTPVLIHIADTDEDSPQKLVRQKGIISDTSKKISLRHLTTTTTTPAELNQRDSGNHQQTSQLLTEQLLQSAKKGIADSTVPYKLPRPSQTEKSGIKVKSLKDIKREKILKARLEYERKKLLASQQEVTEVQEQQYKAESPNTTHQKNAINTSSVTSTSPTKHTCTSSPSQKYAPSDNLEVPNESLEKVEVKSFNEIMEEKRRRKQDNMQSGAGGAGDTAEPVHIHKPIVAARKIKIHSTSNRRKPVRLKRSALRDIHGADEQTKVTKLMSPTNSQNIAEPHDSVKLEATNNQIVVKEHEISEPSRVGQGSDDEGDRDTAPSPATSQATSQVPPPLPEDVEKIPAYIRFESDDEIDNDLLDSSTYLRGETTCSTALRGETTCSTAHDIDDIDDDELFNEMEHLLA